MTIIDISIGRSKYKIDCPEPQKSKLISLASKVNERVNNLSLLMRGADEKMLLVLSAIELEDELESKIEENKELPELKNQLQNLKQDSDLKLSKLSENSKGSSVEIYDKISQKINQVADHIEKLANKVRNS